MRQSLAFVLALAGCYHPLNLDNCRVACGGADQVCPSGMACSAGLCAAPGMTCGLDAPGPGRDGVGTDDGGPPCSKFLSAACVDETKPSLSLSGKLDDTACPALIEQSDQSVVCLFSARTLTVDAGNLAYFVGSYPVAIAADTIVITGTLSVASKQPGIYDTVEVVGAGAEKGCISSGSTQAQTGGGAGGSLATDGGNGGAGWAGQGDQVLHHGPIQVLEGGCQGDSTASSVPGGHGGGAIWLFAAQSITVTGTIDAGGEGGTGGASLSLGMYPGTGGAGGGAGGMIGLESPAIMLASGAYVVANGGGGGGGGGSTPSGPGADGGTTKASGGKPGGMAGTSNGTGGHGGAGAFASSGQGGDSATTAGGGGGGGGDGAIYLIGGGQWSGATIVPSASSSLP